MPLISVIPTLQNKCPRLSAGGGLQPARKRPTPRQISPPSLHLCPPRRGTETRRAGSSPSCPRAGPGRAGRARRGWGGRTPTRAPRPRRGQSRPDARRHLCPGSRGALPPPAAPPRLRRCASTSGEGAAVPTRGGGRCCPRTGGGGWGVEGAARGPVSGRGMRRTAPGSRGEKGSPVRRQFPEGGGDLKYNIGLDLEPIKRNGRTITRNPAESRLQSKGRSARLRVFTSARVAHWAQSPSKRANLLCSLPAPRDLRARGYSPERRCRGDHGTSHASGQEQKPLRSRFPRWCSSLREALK